MEFGIGFWILFLVIFVGCGRMIGWGARRHRRRRRIAGCCGPEEVEPQQDDRLSMLERRVRGLDRGRRERDRLMQPAMYRREEERQREPALSREKRPSALERLQQRFVEGKLSVDEYEREIDRLEKLE